MPVFVREFNVLALLLPVLVSVGCASGSSPIFDVIPDETSNEASVVDSSECQVDCDVDVAEDSGSRLDEAGLIQRVTWSSVRISRLILSPTSGTTFRIWTA